MGVKFLSQEQLRQILATRSVSPDLDQSSGRNLATRICAFAKQNNNWSSAVDYT